jgi:hypothetical protein
MVWKIKKEPERNRIVITVTGDELSSIIPEEVTDLVEISSINGDRTAENAIDIMGKEIFEFYLPIDKTKMEGF